MPVRTCRRVSTALAATVLAGVAVACSASTPAARTGGVPPSGASPEDVARVYLDAAHRGDCQLTAKLTLPHTWRWCEDPKLLRYRAVLKPEHVPASIAGRDEQCVSFDMYTRGSSDGSLPTGWQPWSLCLIRTSSGWRLYDQGQG